ncbi:hypothetical protein GEOBRER4_n0697 [Citrifermentans bremense]|uniref:Uncharacterized protein n=1 Tax=Citrifermentans bremense TaxID=60035 RepID=A0A6S6M2R8_9BACT|nr:hypothetical protein [Citrifermentans bremense]BCG45924.1 hypothetical protein GEOBRER4_n0697 [Citrifermentans bremense]
MVEQSLGSIGQVKEVFTLVDFYQYIKGVEYLICVAFFIGFPIFYRYLHHKGQETKAQQSHH